jgi:hypothetical protein
MDMVTVMSSCVMAAKSKILVEPIWSFAEVGREFVLLLDVENQTKDTQIAVNVTIVTADGIVLQHEEQHEKTVVVEPGEYETLQWKATSSQPGHKMVKYHVESATEVFEVSEEIEVYPAVSLDDPVDTIGIVQMDSAVILKNRYTRIVFIRGERGFGPQVLQARSSDDVWVQMGVIPCLGRLIAGRFDSEVFLYTDTYRVENDKILFDGTVIDGSGVDWEFTVCFELEAESDMVSVVYQITPTGDADLYLFEAPRVLAGEGGFGTQRNIALFPGLEFLQDDQESSSTKDFAEPWNLRMTPHPYAITIPAMSVSANEGTVGVLWDITKTWDGINAHVSAAFASPNRRFKIQGWSHRGENHLMSLFIPTVPDWVFENTEVAMFPYLAEAGTKLSIEAHILVSSNEYPMYALSRWIEYFELPEPAPLPRSLQEELELCGYTYTDLLWVEKAKGWKALFEDPDETAIASAVGAMTLYSGVLLLEDENLQSRFRQRLLDVIPRETSLSASAFDPTGTFYMFFLGGLDRFGLDFLRSYAKKSHSTQRADGSWRYVVRPLPEVGKKWGALGENGMESIYHTATVAMFVLRCARMTGDKDAEICGLKALRYLMETSLKIPQGAPFECPAASPYLLSVAYAIDAFLEGYMLTGDVVYLAEARDWAWKGLHFVYLWNLSDALLQRYATIGVYGSSYYRVTTWIGRPIQWIGLYYARSLFNLSRFDSTFEWETVARGITVSAMYQQLDEGPKKGTYPDSIDGVGVRLNAGFQDRLSAFIQPELIVTNLLRFFGVIPETHSKRLQANDKAIVVNAPTDSFEARLDGNTLYVEIESEHFSTVFLLISGVDAPKNVELNSKQIEVSSNLGWVVENKADGWAHRGNSKELVLRLSLDSGINSLVVEL